MNQYIRYYQMSIECQYMSNICQTQTKGKWDNKTNRRNKREQEKGPRGVSRSEGSKTSSSRVRRFEDFEHHATSCDIMRQMKCLKLEGSKASKIVQRLQKLFSGFMRGFPLHHLSPPLFLQFFYSSGTSDRHCKGNCGPKKHLKCHAHSRASKSTSRESKDV